MLKIKIFFNIKIKQYIFNFESECISAKFWFFQGRKVGVFILFYFLRGDTYNFAVKILKCERLHISLPDNPIFVCHVRNVPVTLLISLDFPFWEHTKLVYLWLMQSYIITSTRF